MTGHDMTALGICRCSDKHIINVYVKKPNRYFFETDHVPFAKGTIKINDIFILEIPHFY